MALTALGKEEFALPPMWPKDPDGNPLGYDSTRAVWYADFLRERGVDTFRGNVTWNAIGIAESGLKNTELGNNIENGTDPDAREAEHFAVSTWGADSFWVEANIAAGNWGGTVYDLRTGPEVAWDYFATVPGYMLYRSPGQAGPNWPNLNLWAPGTVEKVLRRSPSNNGPEAGTAFELAVAAWNELTGG